MIAHATVTLLLLGLSGLLIDQHRRARLSADHEPDARFATFCRKQFRRRMIGSATIGWVGVLLALYPVVPREPRWMAAYLAALLLSVGTILICGILDAFAGMQFYRRVRLEDRLKQAALALELERSTRTSTAPPAEEP